MASKVDATALKLLEQCVPCGHVGKVDGAESSTTASLGEQGGELVLKLGQAGHDRLSSSLDSIKQLLLLDFLHHLFKNDDFVRISDPSVQDSARMVGACAPCCG